jgi:hypothetical protein
MQKVKPNRRKFPAWWMRLVLWLVLAAICCPTLSWGQAAQRIPLELKVKLTDGKIKIGQTFVDALENRIKRSATFRLNSSDTPRLVLRISSEDLPETSYQAVITVIRTVAIPWKGGSQEVFVDNLVMVGVSAAHSGRDAQDILEDTQRNIVPRFNAIRGEVN